MAKAEQAKRDWALLGAVVSTLCMLGALWLSGMLLLSLSFPGNLLGIVLGVGATFGTASLYRFALVADPTGPSAVVWRIGLWIGNVTATGVIVTMPYLVFLAAIPIVSASMVIRQFGLFNAIFFLIDPMVALISSMLTGVDLLGRW